MGKILLISGSPRKGNTDFILSKIYENISRDKELIFLRDKEIKHCLGCLSCHNKPNCVINDDMKEILDKILNAEIIIISTPNYFDNIPGILKDFVDRTHPFYKTKLLENKKLIFIMVGGGEIENSQKCLDCVMKGFVKYHKLNLVSSYCFKALNQTDLKENPETILRINKIIEKINSL